MIKANRVFQVVLIALVLAVPTIEVLAQETQYTLVWSDEFDQNGAPDPSKWYHQTFAPANGSWFNGEEQHYTDRLDNSFVENGLLKIVAKRETFNNGQSTKEYTSARLNSKYAFTYGRVDVRAKLPEGYGTWPAIWTLGQNINEAGGYWQTQGFATTDWPATGEIDLMEHWGDSPNIIHWSNHTPAGFGGNANTNKGPIDDVSNEFHEYSIIWTADEIKYYVDDVLKHTYNPSDKNLNNWPFDEPQYLLLNVAMGGIFIDQEGPRVIDPNFVESAMEIDYVRVYEESIPIAQDARLSDLRIDGETIEGFNINRSDYTYFIPESESSIPTVTYAKNNEDAADELIEATSIPGTTRITVTSEDQSTVKEYSISFKRAVEVPLDFESSEIDYEFVNFGGGVGAVVDNPSNDIINSSDRVLRYTKFDGESFGGIVLPLDRQIDFSEGSIFKFKVNAPRVGAQLTFKLESPTGATELVVSNRKANEWEVMSVDFDGLEKNDYTGITFIWDNGTVGDGSANWVFYVDEIELVSEISTISSLQELIINDTTVSVFDPTVLEYSFELPVGTSDIPLVNGILADENGFIQVTDADELPGTTSILVIAENGNAQTEYSVGFALEEEVDTPLGINEDQIITYPNPVDDVLQIKLQTNQPSSVDLRVSDIKGSNHMLDYETSSNGLSVDVSPLSPGVYFIDFGSNGEKVRFVKR